jgi:hypothetical protein
MLTTAVAQSLPIQFEPASDNTRVSILTTTAAYPLHLLGWKAFQDLCVGVAEECLRRPVQNFLPNNDAGQDGAFVGRWGFPCRPKTKPQITKIVDE